jgi:hypothetical protein
MRLEDIGTLPFPEQLALIDRCLEDDGSVARVLALTRRLRDHEPMAYAVRRLVHLGWMDRPAVVEQVERLLLDLPDTGIQRLLRGLGRVTLTGSPRDALVECASRAIRDLPLERLAATCLLDRWLKNTASDRRSEMIAEAVDRCCEAIVTGDIAAIDERLLARLPGDRLGDLAVLAEDQNAGEAWSGRLRRFAVSVLDVLEAIPKSLSQANAEDLLAHQVYTEPGHFLIELLQNAEDARATCWRVDISAREVSVWHDGVPFDARDVVGVLSIGQTTKHKEQIGLFGVGFKSVYEVAERPQIYSGPFCFEIADVSIPRWLSRRPEGAPDHGTLVVLPLRDPGDPRCDPQQLFSRALAVPPQSLLTLNNIRRLEAGYGSLRRTVVRRPSDEPNRASIDHLESNEVKHYLVETDEFGASMDDRGAHRTMRTPVLIAIALDEQGCPVPVPEDEPTLFSYLPTREQSGLRFLLHAHFDLPVDRERLDLSSAWNRWAIACGGELLARAAERLVGELHERGDPRSARRIDGLLDVLPLPEEVRHPSYRVLIDAMVPRLRDLPILRAASGDRVAPGLAALADDPAVAAVLADISVGRAGRRLLLPVQGRTRALVELLGAIPFGTSELIDLLETHLPDRRRAGHLEHQTGAGADSPPPEPPWLLAAIFTLVDSLGRLATDEELSRLAGLPVLLDQHGQLHRPRDVVRVPDALRWFYQDSRRMLDRTLDLSPTPGQARLWERLNLPRLGLGDLIEDLKRDGPVRRRVATPEGADRLLCCLRAQPDRRQIRGARIERMSLFPDEQGRPGSLATTRDRGDTDEPVWIVPGGPLGDFLRGMEGQRPRLLDPDLQREHGGFLRELGATALELPALLESIRAGTSRPTTEDLWRLHVVLDDLRADLSDRTCLALTRTPVFLDHQGTGRPLRGDGRAWIPMDEGIRRLAPDAPWLDGELIERCPYLRTLSVERVGASALMEEIVSDAASSPLAALDDTSWVHRAYGYLFGHVEDIPPRLAARLAQASFWLDVGGRRGPLEGMRRMPSEPRLAALYQAWGAFSFIDEGADAGHEEADVSAFALCRALRLDSGVDRLGFSTLITDLAERAPIDAASGRLRPLLVDALREADRQLTPRQLRGLKDAPIFRNTSGELLPVGAWGKPDAGRCRRARAPLRAPLGLGTSPILTREDEQELGPLLDRIGVEPAGLGDLITAVEADPKLRDPEAALRVRQALIALKDELRRLVESRSVRVDHLAIWPTTDGQIAPAATTYRPKTLGAVLGTDWDPIIGDGRQVVDASAEQQADDLSELFLFADPVEWVIDRLRSQTRPGAPLADQPDFICSLDKLVHMLKVVVARADAEILGDLPLTLDAHDRLVAGPRYAATADEYELCRGLALFDDLAHPTWALEAMSLTDALTPPLPAIRLVLALREASCEATEAAGHPQLSDPGQRRRLYRWLIAHAEEIGGDVQLRGTFAAAAVIITTHGTLRPPSELLLEPDLPDLGIDWNASDEVPPALVDWLRRTYRLEDRRLEQVLQHLLTAHEAAVLDGDGARSRRLVGFIASSLGGAEEIPDRVRSLPRSIKLRRQLRVESADGRFVRPRQLFLPDAEDWELLETFLSEPPPRVGKRYVDDPAVVQLLETLGARRALPQEVLTTLLSGQGLREGLPASVAFALYLARQWTGNPSVRSQLRLDHAAWIPNGEGALRSPADLYWPSDEALEIIGDQPGAYPHPEFFHEVDQAVGTSLRFKRIEEADLDLIARRIADVGEAPPDMLEWIESGLRQRRLKAAEVRERLWAQPFIIDDRGHLRAPAQLMRDPSTELFGRRRGGWSEARRYPRLADALGISRSAGVREVARFLDEVAADIIEREELGEGGESLLDEEPELARCLPRNLTALAQKNAPAPANLPLAVTDGGDRTTLITLATTPRAHVAVPDPPELVEALAWSASSGEACLPFLPVLGPEHQELVLSYLTRSAGLRTLGQLWAPDPVPNRLPGDCTDQYAEMARGLEATLAALMARLPRLRANLRHIPKDAWRPVKDDLLRAWKVQVVRDLEVTGQLGQHADLTVNKLIAVEPGRLILTQAMVGDVDEIAAHLCREVILDGRLEARLHEVVVELICLGSADQMDLDLDGRGFRPTPGGKPSGVGRRQRQGGARRRGGDDDRGGAVDPVQDGAADPGQDDGRAAERGAARRAEAGFWTRVRSWWRREPKRRQRGDIPRRDSEPRQDAASPRPQETGTERRVSRKRSDVRGAGGPRGRPRALPHEHARRSQLPPQQPSAPPPGAGRIASGSSQPRGRGAAQPTDHAQWFQPRSTVGQQLDPRQQPADRRKPAFGLSFAPSPLPGPYLYGVKQILSRFDPTKQRWLSAGIRSEWLGTAGRRGDTGQVRLRGRLPGGQAHLPVPLFACLDIDDLETAPAARAMRSRTGQMLLSSREATDVGYSVTLLPLPGFEPSKERSKAPSVLLDLTAPDRELPQEVHELIDAVQEDGGLTPLTRCMTIRDFIRDNYTYDRSYLEDPNIARWLRSVSKGRMNTHLAALHAGRDARSLGRGVCYELNILACEMLRRAGIPAGIAVGWTFDRGSLAEPDHLWAMALLDTDQGLRWHPIDASTTRDGRPLHVGDRPAGPWRVKAPRGVSLPQVAARSSATVKHRQQKDRIPTADLIRVARHLEVLTGQKLDDEATLRRRFRQLLSDPGAARELLAVLTDEGEE